MSERGYASASTALLELCRRGIVKCERRDSYRNSYINESLQKKDPFGELSAEQRAAFEKIEAVYEKGAGAVLMLNTNRDKIRDQMVATILDMVQP